MTDELAEGLLLGAELWEGDGEPSFEAARFVAGWEDGATFCAAVCTTDVGLAFCRECPAAVAGWALERRRAAADRCPAGVRLLAFPAPAGSTTSVAVLRVAPPAARAAAAVADRVQVPASALRRAARDTAPANGRATLVAARTLRDPARNRAWQVDQRARGADRRRAAGQALAQMIATSDEVHQLYRESQRQRRQLERNRRLVDRLARETLRAQDEERSRIAHEIHDTAAQSMVSAFRFVDAARATSGANGREPDPRLVNASDRIQTAIREVRSVLARLLPPGLEELGLADALRTRIQAERDGGFGGETVGDLPRLQPSVEQALYGMASEAISNAARHSGAASVRVELRVVRGQAVVTVTDEGRGFSPATVVRTAGGGLGLVGMTRQASWLGGSTRIVSRAGAGTTVRISVPLARHIRPVDGRPAGTRAGAADDPPQRSEDTGATG